MANSAQPWHNAEATSRPPAEEEFAPALDPETGIDLSLIEENLKLTPWERLLANDDAVNFCEAARDALRAQHAETNATASEASPG